MHSKHLSITRRSEARAPATTPVDQHFDRILWLAWALIVGLVGTWQWYADRVAQRALDTLALVIHCVLAGIIGLVVLTLVEMRIAPERFLA